jgi:hypothetical protein
VFDVAVTGDPSFARGYLVAQDLRLHSTTVQLTRNKGHTHTGEDLVVTAIVAPLTSRGPLPKGTVTFLIDNAVAGQPVNLDAEGRAFFTTSTLEVGEHKIRAIYNAEQPHHASSSANLLHTVAKPHRDDTGTLGTPGTAGTGTTRCPSLCDLFKLYAGCFSGLAARIRTCLDHVTPCSCGGDHTQAEHPAAASPDQPPAHGGGTAPAGTPPGGKPPGTGGHGR